MSSDTDAIADVLVLGASFAGVEFVRKLRRQRAGRALRVLVIDRQARHGYVPLVQERLCQRLRDDDARLETQALIDADPHVRYVVGEIEGLDPERGEVTLRGGARLRGRFVVVALGSILAPPAGLPGGERLLRYKLEGPYEQAAARLRQILSEETSTGDGPRLVVIGGGISGVELAGELASLRRARPPGWRAPAVTLIHGGARLLPGLCAAAGRKAARYLVEQGVELRLSTRLAAVRDGEVLLRPAGDGPRRGGDEPYRPASDDGEPLTCAAALWAGGLRPAPALARLGLPRTEDGWLAVGPTLQCFPEARPRLPGVFACGDAARVIGGDGAIWPTMQRAIECLWQAELVARSVALLAAAPEGFPSGVPPLPPHRLREDFFHGVSVGARSMIVRGPLAIELGGLAIWFRRFLMRQYFALYRRAARGRTPDHSAR